jgi:long-chain acyl-CoA synthetase
MMIGADRGQPEEGPVREYSIPALVEVPAAASLADVVFTRAAQDPHSVVMRRRTGDGRWDDVTAAQFRDQVAALAKGLVAAGIEPGDRVALMSRTRYEWTLIDYAIWAAGGVTVPIYETSSAEQVEWILSDSGARAAFAETSRHAGTIGEVRGRVPALEHVWLIDAPVVDGTAGADGTETLAGLAAGSAAASVTDEQIEQHRAARKAADLATIIYTSGTTGRPKGCEITHGNLLSDVRNAVQGALMEVFEIAGSSTLLFMPLAHSFARIIEVGCLESGAILGHWPDTATVAQGLPEFQPTFLLAVPRVFEKVYNTAQQQASESKAKSRIFRAAVETAIAWSTSRDATGLGGGAGQGLRLRHALFDRLVYARLRAAVGGRVAYAVSGGAPLGERLGHFFRGAGITILEGYGLTETSAAATVNKPSRNKIGTVGQPLPGVAIKIADDGEILLRGPNVTPGYWHNETATAEALDPEGWLRSGDVGSLDDEGFLRVTGRKKEIIVTAGGKNVAPAVLEDRLRAHPLISQCIVVGDGRPYVACLITLDPEALEFWKKQHGRPADATLATLSDDPELIADIQLAVDEANQAVSRAESIRRFRILGTDFTEVNGYLTPSLKVRRNLVTKDFAAEIEAIYAAPRES